MDNPSNLRGSNPAQLLNQIHPNSGEAPGAFGITPDAVSDKQQLDFVLELGNKLAWALGSAYKQPYSGKRNPVRDYVRKLTGAILRDHGYHVNK